MSIPSDSWDSRLTTGQYSSDQYRTRYRDLADAIDDAFDNYEPDGLQAGTDTREGLRGVLVASEAYIAWLSNNLLGSVSPLGGDSFENPFAFSYSDVDKESFLRSLGCRATPREMCRAYAGKGKTGTLTTGVSFTLFGLALCDEGVRDQLGNNYDAFEWEAGGTLKVYDRYNFTDLSDFGGVQGHGVVKSLITNIFGQSTGGIVGILNNLGIPQAVQSFFNVASNSPDYDASPYFEWRGDGDTFTVTSITRTNRTVTVTTSGPHGMTNEDGGGIKIVDGDNTFNIPDTGINKRPNGVDITVVDANTFTYYDPFDRPDASSDGTGVTAVQKKRWGKSRMMYTVDTYSPSDILRYNPELYFDAVSRGYIPYSLVPGVLDVGDKQPNPTVAGIAGMTPQAPVKGTIHPTNFSGVFDYPNYPQPYNSWSQGITNETYHLGPYASIPKLIYAVEEAVGNCFDIEEWNGNDPLIVQPLYGRLAILTSGPHAGEVGFFLQPWYDFDDTPYNTNDGTTTGVPFKSKAEWWRGATKSKAKARFAHLSSQPLVYVEVAYGSSEFGDVNYYPGPDLGSQADGLVELASVLTATAAISGIVF